MYVCEKFVSCSVVLPALCHLLRVTEVSEDHPAYMIKFKQSIKAEMEETQRKEQHRTAEGRNSSRSQDLGLGSRTSSV